MFSKGNLILKFIVSSNFLGLLVSSYFFGLCLIYWDIAEGPREINTTVTLEHIKNRGDVARHWQHKSPPIKNGGFLAPFLQVLDARDPGACRSPALEREADQQG